MKYSIRYGGRDNVTLIERNASKNVWIQKGEKTQKHSAEVEWLWYYLLSAKPFYKLHC